MGNYELLNLKKFDIYLQGDKLQPIKIEKIWDKNNKGQKK
jgi:hypothetical protein